MTQYTEIDSNIRRTWFLILGFLSMVILIGWFLSYYYDSPEILLISTVFSIGTSITSYWFSDKIVLAATKANPVSKEKEAELYRIVENLSITAGLPMPKIYVIEEGQPNAFATGRNPENSVVAVTRGLLQKLNRTELEGVIAHELSHIGNRDILLATVVVILVGVISGVSNLFLRMGFGRKKNDRSRGGAGAILMVLGVVAVILAPIAATILKLALSRKREFLADASGALLTRYPEGLASALEKIAGDPNPLRVPISAAHLFISSPLKGEDKDSWFSKLFMTHPPVKERIKILRGMPT